MEKRGNAMLALPLRECPRIASRAPANDEIDFARLVGTTGWGRLPDAVRRRFAHAPSLGREDHYSGTMQVVACSRLGFALAQASRLIRTPFAPFAAENVAVRIALKKSPRGNGIVWERTYLYPGRAPIRVCSTKRLASDGVLTERVGGGFGMRLAVYEENRALHFCSTRYFLRIGPLEIPLPHFLSPGVAHVIHSDLGNDHFRFEMTIRHAVFGTLFHQDGTFHADGDSP